MQLDGRENLRELSPADLRGILKYVPLWRNHTFVIALDGAVVETGTIGNLMLELAVLRNLGIRLLIVYGIGAQIQQLAEERQVAVSDARGLGPTDQTTLSLAIEASGKVGHLIERGLTQNGLKCARVNAVRATDRGIVKGKQQLLSGKVDRVDAELLSHLMKEEIVPVIGPVAFNKDGSERRLNSDQLASDLAIALKASKLIYLLPHAGLTYNGELRLNADVAEVRNVLDTNPELIDELVRSKARYAVQTVDAGTPRAHIIDCRIHDGLLMEVFSKVGIGSMIHSNPYSQIRKARRKDVSSIYTLTRGSVRDESLRARSKASIDSAITDYFVYEIDGSIIGCFRISYLPNSLTGELASVAVHPAYRGRHIGKSMVDFAIESARQAGCKRLIALTTQAAPFFKETCGFQSGTLQDLPEELRQTLRKTGRNSEIYLHDLI